ncbi:hypothetical protein C2E20_5906 [Micractinium conductrix]|uniref:UBA domain-containing protein n=1 Tax=Micractinium conductrix TaxID=554055 RepID=A0A2P6V9A3_9CHLO|nr:hypothetical protein C2E20_5906 [Micractinium conductrix]|eukprot:PSC70670.1 hypothetical protein C2E20_5906 [Micractinium conductrix]
MYPTIQFDPNPLHSSYPNLSSAAASSSSGTTAAAAPSLSRPAAAPAPLPPRANGPPPPPPSSGFPTLQVTIDPRFQVAPPVRAPSQPPGQGGPAAGAHGGAAPPPPPSQPAPGGEPLDLDLERRLVSELGASGSGSGVPGSKAASGQQGEAGPSREDPYDVLLTRYTDMGYSRQAVALALAVVGPERSDAAEQIVETCRKLKSLTSMGFSSELAAGALVSCGGDVEAAASTLLDTAS